MSPNQLPHLLATYAAFLAHGAENERNALFKDFCGRLSVLRSSAQRVENALITPE